MVDFNPGVSGDSNRVEPEAHAAACSCGNEVWGPIPAYLAENPVTNESTARVSALESSAVVHQAVQKPTDEAIVLANADTDTDPLLKREGRQDFIFASTDDGSKLPKNSRQMFADRILQQYGIANIYSVSELREALKRRSASDDSLSV